MKKWNEQTPVMSSAALMKTYREKIWVELRDNPDLSVQQVEKYENLIAQLNKQIARRSYNPDRVLQLINEVVRQGRSHKRTAKKLKISKRSVKFILKENRKKNGKRKPNQKPKSVQKGLFE